MKKDDDLDLDFHDIKPAFPSTRREFLRLMGGGLFILFSVGDSLFAQEQPRQRRVSQRLSDDFNAFLRIGEDGRVSCFTGKIEMGQGIITSLAQMLADELEVPLDSVDMVMGDTALCPWDMGTFGSMSTRFFGPPLRAAAAEARAVLVELAAEYLKTPPSQLKVEAGVIFHPSESQKRVTYAQLTQGKSIARRLKKEVVLERASDFTIVGTPVLRRDAEDKVTGKAKFAGDLREPDMLYARIVRPPAHGARLIRVDTSAAKEVKGARVVETDDLVAVLHEDPELAEEALKQIKTRWMKPVAQVDERTIFDRLVKIAPQGEIVSPSLASGAVFSQASLCR